MDSFCAHTFGASDSVLAVQPLNHALNARVRAHNTVHAFAHSRVFINNKNTLCYLVSTLALNESKPVQVVDRSLLRSWPAFV